MLGEHCPRLDKKREKAILADSRVQLRAHLEAEDAPAPALMLAVTLIHLELNNVLMSAPAKLLGMLIEPLHSRIEPEAVMVLTSCQKAVQDSLGGCEANDVELKQRIDEVRQLGLHRGKLDAKEDGAG